MMRADAVVDPDRASKVYGVVLLVMAALIYPVVDGVYNYANETPAVLEELRALADRPREATMSRPLIVMLLDGLRTDEVATMPSLVALKNESLQFVMKVDPPTVSRPAYHAFFTGVPSAASGVVTNRYLGGPRADTLANRVREAGGEVVFIAEGLDWMPSMFASAGDRAVSSDDALNEPLDEALATLSPTSFVMIHVVSIDQRGHDDGLDSAARRGARGDADDVVARVMRSAPDDALIVAFADHGHVAAGGHGGSEPEVDHVFAYLHGAGADGAPLGGEVNRTVSLVELAPTIASILSLPPPRMAVVPPVIEVAPRSRSSLQAERFRRAHHDTLVARLDRVKRARLFQFVTAFLCFALLGTTKRCFGFSWATLSFVFAMGLGAVGHLFVFRRPLSFSSIDYLYLHIPRLVGLGALCTLAATLPWRDLARRRQAAAICSFASLTALLMTLATIAWTVRPWPIDDFLAYAPMLFGGYAMGSCVAGALCLWALVDGRPGTE